MANKSVLTNRPRNDDDMHFQLCGKMYSKMHMRVGVRPAGRNQAPAAQLRFVRTVFSANGSWFSGEYLGEGDCPRSLVVSMANGNKLWVIEKTNNFCKCAQQVLCSGTRGNISHNIWKSCYINLLTFPLIDFQQDSRWLLTVVIPHEGDVLQRPRSMSCFSRVSVPFCFCAAGWRGIDQQTANQRSKSIGFRRPETLWNACHPSISGHLLRLWVASVAKSLTEDIPSTPSATTGRAPEMVIDFAPQGSVVTRLLPSTLIDRWWRG